MRTQRLLPFTRLSTMRLNIAVVAVVLTGALIGPSAHSPVLAQQEAANRPDEGEAGTGLPPNYTPPKAPPPVMTHVEPLITEARMKDLEKDKFKYSKMLRAGDLNGEARRLIPRWAELRLNEMTLPEAQLIVRVPVKVKDLAELPKDRHDNIKYPEQPELVAELRHQLLREYASAATLPGAPDPQGFRKFVAEQLVEKAKPLLSNNFHVRLNTVLLLSQLEVSENRPYSGSYKPLIEVLAAPTGGALDQQPEAVKVAAARGLTKIALRSYPDLLVNEKQAIADALIAELQDPDSHWWYQQALIEALGNVDLVNSPGNNRPFLLDTLGKILTDENRTLCVRAEAAKAIGRIPLPQGINMDTLVYRIVHLAQEMAEAQRLQPKNPQWTGCFAKLYLAFHPANEREQQLYRPRGAGLLEKQPQAGVVQEGFKQIVPLVSHTQTHRPGRGTAPQKLPDQTVAALATWLTKNRPGSNKLAPYLEDLPALDPPKAAAVSANGVE